MRHFVSSIAITSGSKRMGEPASGAALVARSSSPKRQLSLDPGACLAAVDIAPVAAAAQHHLLAAARADKQSASFEFAHRSTP
jgi:hypothetical protein